MQMQMPSMLEDFSLDLDANTSWQNASILIEIDPIPRRDSTSPSVHAPSETQYQTQCQYPAQIFIPAASDEEVVLSRQPPAPLSRDLALNARSRSFSSSRLPPRKLRCRATPTPRLAIRGRAPPSAPSFHDPPQTPRLPLGLCLPPLAMCSPDFNSDEDEEMGMDVDADADSDSDYSDDDDDDDDARMVDAPAARPSRDYFAARFASMLLQRQTPKARKRGGWEQRVPMSSPLKKIVYVG